MEHLPPHSKQSVLHQKAAKIPNKHQIGARNAFHALLWFTKSLLFQTLTTKGTIGTYIALNAD